MPLLIMGSVAIDDIATQAASQKNLLGGAASYAAIAASFFDKVRLVSIVGNDFPETYLQLFRERGIDLQGLHIDRNGKTFRWSGIYEQNMNHRRTLAVQLNVIDNYMPTLPGSYRDSTHVLLGNMSPQTQLHVLSQLRNPAVIAADTMDLWIQTARPELLQLLSKIHILTINDTEAAQLSGEDNILKAAAWLREQGPPYVIIKKGEHGSLLAAPQGNFVSPAYLLPEVIDPTGAGDSFAGALLGYLAAHKELTFATLKKAVVEATILASFTVQDFGINSLINLTPDQLQQRKQHLLQLTAY